VLQLVSEVRKSEREREELERGLEVGLAHRRTRSSSATETECGQVFGGVWELSSRDFWAEWSRRGGFYRVRPGGVIAHVNLAN
jgi:hypothetical protein